MLPRVRMGCSEDAVRGLQWPGRSIMSITRIQTSTWPYLSFRYMETMTIHQGCAHTSLSGQDVRSRPLGRPSSCFGLITDLRVAQLLWADTRVGQYPHQASTSTEGTDQARALWNEQRSGRAAVPNFPGWQGEVLSAWNPEIGLVQHHERSPEPVSLQQSLSVTNVF